MSARQSRRASPRILLAGALVVALVGATAALVSAFTGGGTSPKALAGAAEARLLFDGIPQSENMLGSPAAPVTLVEYADLQCPYCRDFELQTTPALVERYVRTGQLKIVFRPLAFIGPDSVRGRNAVIAAGLQGKLFETVQLLYANQGTENTGWLDDGMVEDVAAASPGLDAARFGTAQGSAGVARRAGGFDAQATAGGIHSTPTLLVGKSGGSLRQVEQGQLVAEIESALG
jgi:protein-disulfide isomerase